MGFLSVEQYSSIKQCPCSAMFRHGLLRNTVQSAHMKRYTNSRDFTRENPLLGDQDYKNQLHVLAL